MIGVAASPADQTTAAELFELFKTAWEPARPDRHYDVVLSTVQDVDHLHAGLFLIYGTDGHPARPGEADAARIHGTVRIDWGEAAVPVYGGVAVFSSGVGAPAPAYGGRPLWRRDETGGTVVWRIGYDLFHEVRYLLAEGQPPEHAAIPTLELHIAFLRHLLEEAGAPFVEILPRPDGHDFICCLTHDVDFFGIRRHLFDRTLAGFVARGSLGTLADLSRGQRTLGEAVGNWAAVLTLPLALARLARDFWHPFEDYARVERPAQSTFFLVPFKDRPGVGPDGVVRRARGVPYDVRRIGDDVRRAAAAGSEIAVHGIDAWRDAGAGRQEISALASLTARPPAGVRMHWLYFGPDSPRHLEAAGFEYDSTCGYNDAAGYRAGTSQVFRWPGCQRLLELPLSVMDTALFYRQRMGLTFDQAAVVFRTLVANARRFGGTVVVNWHDRSLAPERQWGRSYRDFLDAVTRGGTAWFATASEAVAWFRWRRSIHFSPAPAGGLTVEAREAAHALPAATLRIHHGPCGAGARVEERRFDGQRVVVAL